MPPWIYKVTATDLNCPDASFVHFGGNGTLDSAISNTTEKEKSPNHACDYCIYPITITCVSFAFCVVYLLMLVVAYAGVSVKIGSQKLLSRLRLLLLLYTVLVPLLVCVQAVLRKYESVDFKLTKSLNLMAMWRFSYFDFTYA